MKNTTYSDYFALQARQQAMAATPMDMQAAVEFMEELKALPSLRIDYGDNGCEDRSNLVQFLLKNRNVPHGCGAIQFPDTHQWHYHFAAYGEVATNAGPQKVMFDPTEFDQIILLDDWKKAWNARTPKPICIFTASGMTTFRKERQLLENLHAYSAEAT